MEKTRWKKEGEESECGQEKRAERKIEERADWTKQRRTMGEPNKSDAWLTMTQKCSKKTRCTGRDPGKINTICGTRASNKEEIKMTLDQARKRFLYTPAGKD